MWQGAETDVSLHGALDCLDTSYATLGHLLGAGGTQQRAPLLPVKGSLDMQSNSVTTVLSFCFLSDSPLDSHVNMWTCTWLRQTQESSPSRPKGWLSLSVRVRSKAHFISDWGILSCCQRTVSPRCIGCSVERVFKDVTARRQTVSVLLS